MTYLEISVDNRTTPPRMLIDVQGLVMRQVVREKLTELELPYTERKAKFFTSTFEVPLPEGRDTGKIREYLANRPNDPLLK